MRYTQAGLITAPFAHKTNRQRTISRRVFRPQLKTPRHHSELFFKDPAVVFFIMVARASDSTKTSPPLAELPELLSLEDTVDVLKLQCPWTKTTSAPAMLKFLESECHTQFFMLEVILILVSTD